MWCKQCQQDVPGLVSSEQGMFCCPRCTGALQVHSAHQPSTAATDGGLPGAAATVPSAGGASGLLGPPYDDWEIDEQLRHIGRVLGAGTTGQRPQTDSPRQPARLDRPHAGAPPWHAERPVKPARNPAAGTVQVAGVLPSLTWGALSLGTMAFVCGGMLLGWSLASGRQELWTVGMPVALGGQVALLVGLVLQLERIWHNSRHAAVRLQRVDEQLHDLQAATTLLGTSHASPGGAFYAHLANGAGPGLLLSDLKAQLDLLALRISRSDEG